MQGLVSHEADSMFHEAASAPAGKGAIGRQKLSDGDVRLRAKKADSTFLLSGDLSGDLSSVA